jgi:phenylacetate-CoA ligase
VTVEIWNREMECQDRDELAQLQLERLQATLNRACKSVPFYLQGLQECGLSPSALRSLDDLVSLPFTTREDLNRSYPYGLFAVPLRDIVRIHSATGTGLRPTVSGYTGNDLGIWKEVVARCLTAAGVGPEDIVQICFDPGLANWARDFKDGAETVEASVIPMTPLEIPKQLMIMNDYKTSVLVTTPSYLGQLSQEMGRRGLPPKALALRRAVLAGEAMSQATRSQLEEGLHIQIHTAYGLSEVPGPGIAYECQERRGLHLNEDHFLAEIVDPAAGTPLPLGKEGELVLTTLTAKAYPLLRFRTGDLALLTQEACPCGRTFTRLEMTAGRADQLVVIRGVRLHPDLIEGIMTRMVKGAQPAYVAFVKRAEELDLLEVWVEVNEALFSDEIKVLEILAHRIRRELEQSLGIPARVRLVEPRTMSEHLGCLGRIIDERRNG